ncbi:MAG: amidohydrolase family protein [Candidatus Aminicenantes bacterium]|nr:amidohydrolase family protein [Candidatus Aminicenantes bacterium]
MKKRAYFLFFCFLPTISLLNLPPDLKAEETSFIKSTAAYKKIKSEIDKIKVVDNHEHIKSEPFRVKEGKPDFFDLVTSDYTGADIGNIGNTFGHDTKYLDETLSIEERWASFKPIYDRIKNTGYMRCLRLGIKKIHGIEITDASSIKKINESMDRLYQPGIYTRTLRDLGKIDYVLVYRSSGHFGKDDYPDFFRVVRYIDSVIIFNHPQDIYKLEEQYRVSVHSLDDLEKIYGKFVEESIEDGVVGFKYGGAYLRTLDHSSYSREKAEAVLKKLLRFTGWGRSAITVEGGEELTNYCFNLMLKVIEEKGMPISIHTGLQTGGYKDIRWSNPQHLIPLFREYKNVNFDLFHGGFPFMKEFAELGKSWPNVFLNFCWFHTISPEGARSLLSELLELVPVHKIFAFGADTNFPESTIGHLEMAKENCAIVLTEKVLNGYFTEEEAIEYAIKILRTNSIEFFNLE